VAVKRDWGGRHALAVREVSRVWQVDQVARGPTDSARDGANRWTQADLNLKFQFKSKLNLYCAKSCLLNLEKIEIKYGSVGFEIGNNFYYWNFFRFKIKLKFKELLWVKFN
jgi:hypothetical protein